MKKQELFKPIRKKKKRIFLEEQKSSKNSFITIKTPQRQTKQISNKNSNTNYQKNANLNIVNLYSSFSALNSYISQPNQQYINNKTNKNIKVVVKTNYVMAGRLKPNGIRATKSAVGTHSSSVMDYINNHGHRDLEVDTELSNIYNETGERLSKKDFYDLKKSFEKDNEISAMRRIVISPKEDITREQMKELTIKTLQEFQEKTAKNLDFKFAVHTDTEHIHSHILITGSNSDINFTAKQLKIFKESANEIAKDLELKKEITLDKTLNIKQDREVSL